MVAPIPGPKNVGDHCFIEPWSWCPDNTGENIHTVYAPTMKNEIVNCRQTWFRIPILPLSLELVIQLH